MEEKQKRKEFNEKWKKKREEEEANDKNRDKFLFDSYMKMDDFQSRPNEVNQPSTQSGQTNPRTKRIGYNAKKPKQPRKTAPSQHQTQVFDANENMSTDNFESFEGSPVKGNEENEDNSLLTTKTFGMDDFTSTTDLDKSMKSTKNDNDTVDFTKTLQSELGSDEDGQFKSTVPLDQVIDSVAVLTKNPDENHDDNQTESNA